MAKPVVLEKGENGYYVEGIFACKEEDLWATALKVYFYGTEGIREEADSH